MTNLNFGVGYRVPHYQYIQDYQPENISFFEVITENFVFSQGRPRQFLKSLRENYPIVLHGVGLALGNLAELDNVYLKALKNLIEEIQPEMVSDHLCWTSIHGHNSHDLLPVTYTEESLQFISTKITQAQEYLQREILIENPSSYVSFASNTMIEAEFMAALCTKTGCKVLLDLNNIFVNHKNLNLNPQSYFANLNQDHVRQFHMAGHSVHEDLRIDTHDHAPCQEVLDLYHQATRIWPNVPTLLEWDDNIPDWPQLMAELDHVKKYYEGDL